MYQKDVSTAKLTTVASAVVESCVHFAGVDLNTASAVLLRHVSGVSKRAKEGTREQKTNNEGYTIEIMKKRVKE